MAEMKFHVRSPLVDAGQRVQAVYTCDGQDVPPPLAWGHLPEGTRSMALVMDDPDAPGGTFTHWLLWDIRPVSEPREPVDVSGRGVAGRNDFQGIGYGGPCPPPKHGPHRYRIWLHALDIDSLGLKEGASRDDLERAMRGHIIERAELIGQYERR
jgi:Raf kinase inhibitor-like YbhB/YbcL family protein